MKRWSTHLVRLFWLLAGLPVAFISWHTPLSTGFRELPGPELSAFTSALAESGVDPIDFVVRQFDEHDVVIVGEAHRVAQDALFIQSLIPQVYHRQGVRSLVIEFGRRADQELADYVTSEPVFHRQAAKQLIGGFDSLWLYEEYLGLYRAAWELNQSLRPTDQPFRILLGSQAPDRATYKDTLMAQLVLGELDAQEKVLVYCGRHHGFTHYVQPHPARAPERNARGRRMGNQLFEVIGERVSFLCLHAPFAKRWAFFASPLYRRPMLSPFGGVIDRAAAAIGKPVAFDTNLSHLGLPSARVQPAPPRAPPQLEFGFEGC